MNLLVGKFHVHLTLDCKEFNNKIHSWKTTVIQLSKGEKQQLDVMLTKHYFIPSTKTNSVQDIKDDVAKAVASAVKAGYKVIRVKLEHESLPTIAPNKHNYRECHIKLELPKQYDLNVPEGFVKSKNPLAQTQDSDVYFINKRWYDGDVTEIDKSAQEVAQSLGSFVREVKLESIVIDSNQTLDKWWA